VGDPPLPEYLPEYTPSYDDIRLRVEGLKSDTIYYFHIYQYDDYAQEDSEPYPTLPDPPLEVRTLESQDFTIINKICDHKITNVYFNDEMEEQPLPTEDFIHDVEYVYEVCQKPDSIQVRTEHINSDPPIIYSYDFRSNIPDSIEVKALVKILHEHDWKSFDITVTGNTLVFDSEGNFEFFDEVGEIDNGTFDEDYQDCNRGEIIFEMKFGLLGVAQNCIYEYSTNKITIPSFPSTGAPAEFVYEQ